MTPADSDLAVDDHADLYDECGSGSAPGSAAKSNESDRLLRFRDFAADEDGSPTDTSVDDEADTPTVTAVDDVEVEDLRSAEEDANASVRRPNQDAELSKDAREAIGRCGSVRVARAIAGVMGAAEEGSSRKTMF